MVLLVLKYASILLLAVIAYIGSAFELTSDDNRNSKFKYRKNLNKYGKLIVLFTICSTILTISIQVGSDVQENFKQLESKQDQQKLVNELQKSIYPLREVSLSVDLVFDPSGLKLSGANSQPKSLKDMSELGLVASSFKDLEVKLAIGKLLPLGYNGDIDINAPLFPFSLSSRFSKSESIIRYYLDKENNVHIGAAGRTFISNNGTIAPSLKSLSGKNVRVIVGFADRKVEKYLKRVTVYMRNELTGNEIKLESVSKLKKLDFSKFSFVSVALRDSQYYFDQVFPIVN